VSIASATGCFEHAHHANLAARENGRFVFQAEIAHPLTGLIIRYRGALTPRVGAAQSRRRDG
jgi:hypothetical protein